jgi:hypothetical protein
VSDPISIAALARRHSSPPDRAYLSLVEAASFLAFGGFLGSNDLAAVTLEQGTDEEEQDLRRDAIEDWSRARDGIVAKAGEGTMTLLGRRAPQFGAEPQGDHVAIPVEFFAPGPELVLGLSDALYVGTDPYRTMYYDVRVATDEFVRVFPAPRPTRPATAQEKEAIRAHAERVYAETSRAPSLGELWAAFPQVSRSSLRAIIKELPLHLQREVGR